MSLLVEYLQAQIPPAFAVGGISLRPLCLGHAMLLQRLHSPFAPEPVREQIGRADCLLALWVLSRPATAAIRDAERRKVVWWLRWQGWRLRRLATEELVRQLRHHVAIGSRGPHWRPKGKPSAATCGSPLLLSLKRTQMCEYGADEAGALNKPLSLVKWEHCAYLEANDALVITKYVSRAMAVAQMFPGKQLITAEQAAILRAGGNPWAKPSAETGGQTDRPAQTPADPATGTESPAAGTRQST